MRGNMAASGGNERASLGSFAKKQTKYGSTCNHIFRKRKTIKHAVQPDDTLQGLALRYGVTMEDIKRANKLWTSDSLFLRTSLDIPVASDLIDTSPFSSDGDSTPVTSPSKSPTGESMNNGNTLFNEYSVRDSNSGLGLLEIDDPNLRKGISDEESIADFLIRIDSSIAQSKDKIKVLERNIGYPADDIHLNRSRNSTGSSYARNSLGSSSMSDLSSDPSLAPHPIVMTQGRKVKSSLRRHEREHEEIFEL